MIASGMSGVQMRFMGRMRGDYEKISGGAGESFLVIRDLRWVMVTKLDLRMTCGAALKVAFSNLVIVAHFKDAFVANHLGVF
jgi:hypothetical protein